MYRHILAISLLVVLVNDLAIASPSLGGLLCYDISQDGTSVSLDVEQIVNSAGSARTGSLRILLWGVPLDPEQSNWEVLAGEQNTLAPLPSGGKYNFVHIDSVFLPPPCGDYCMLIAIEEFDGEDWQLSDYWGWVLAQGAHGRLCGSGVGVTPSLRSQCNEYGMGSTCGAFGEGEGEGEGDSEGGAEGGNEGEDEGEGSDGENCIGLDYSSCYAIGVESGELGDTPQNNCLVGINCPSCEQGIRDGYVSVTGKDPCIFDPNAPEPQPCDGAYARGYRAGRAHAQNNEAAVACGCLEDGGCDECPDYARGIREGFAAATNGISPCDFTGPAESTGCNININLGGGGSGGDGNGGGGAQPGAKNARFSVPGLNSDGARGTAVTFVGLVITLLAIRYGSPITK